MPETPVAGSSRPRRFRAPIRRQGPNPYVDVPPAVSRAFAAHARAGRIHFVGTLEGAPVRGSLVPVGRGRHRLFVNGGMRSAAGVSVGDTVVFAIRAVPPGAVPLPADLAGALRRARGARAAFDARSPSYRRQLLRYIDDARTPETRRRRVERTVRHVLGKPAPAKIRGEHLARRALWTCPRCGNAFVNRNQYHSCGRLDPSVPFAGKPGRIRELFERFRGMVEACGPVTLVPYRDRIGFMVRVRFAGAVPKARWLDIGFWLPRRIESPRFRRIETLYPDVHIHLLRVTEPDQLDPEVAGWLREAYAVGCQEHLRSSPRG